MRWRVAGTVMVAVVTWLTATLAPAQERYCNGRPKVFRGMSVYPNGKPLQMGEMVLFPNGNPTTDEHGMLLFPSGAPFVLKGRPLYPNGRPIITGSTVLSPSALVFYQNGVFYDDRARPSREGPSTITTRWRDYEYIFDVVDGIPSTRSILIKAFDQGLVISFKLEDGVISEVDAACSPRQTPSPTPVP